MTKDELVAELTRLKRVAKASALEEKQAKIASGTLQILIGLFTGDQALEGADKSDVDAASEFLAIAAASMARAHAREK